MTKILLVEDNEENRDMLGRRLSRAGFYVCYAGEGETGIRIALNEMPDIILMDIALGENAMDGWEATRYLKSNPKTAGIPIIALTAHALSTDRQKSIEVGCAEFDTKPVDLERLLRKLNACLNARQSAA
jgi:CheY-like chemotaxis protein